MALDHQIISQFAKLVNNNQNSQNGGTIVYGTIVDKNGHKPDDEGVIIDENGQKYFKPDGSDQLIPIDNSTSDPNGIDSMVTTDFGDRASVTIKDHTAIVTGNMSSPSVGDRDVEKAITKFDIAVGEKIQANKGYFKDLTADKANMGNLAAAIISVAELIAKDVKIEELIAGKITVDDLIAKKIDANVVIADDAILDNLKTNSADILSLIADVAKIKTLMADEANISFLEAVNSSLKYADIDLANINTASISKLFADYGIINELIIEDGTVVKELVGVTITGDLIKAGTLKADKLIVKGTDGKYYALNTDFSKMSGVEPVPEDTIHGSTIVANSITAEKLAVDELAAFDATLGGFHIKGSTETRSYDMSGFDVSGCDTNPRGWNWDVSSASLSGTTLTCTCSYDIYTDVTMTIYDINILKEDVANIKTISIEIIGFDEETGFPNQHAANICIEHTNGGAIYSGAKTSINADSITGIYLDSDGQVAFGNKNNCLKFYKDTDGSYKLFVSADNITFGAGKQFFLNNEGITVEGASSDTNNTIKTIISNNGMVVDSNDQEVLKANDKGVVAKDLHAKTYLIVGDNSRFENYKNNGIVRTGCFWIGG